MEASEPLTPFEMLPGGLLLTPWHQLLPGVAASKRLYGRWYEDFVIQEPLPLPLYLAMRAIMSTSRFDPVCGHWLATRRFKRGYCYVSMKLDGKQRDVGVHVVAQMVQGTRFVPEVQSDGKLVLPPVDHKCRYWPCFNPFHTEVTTTGENTRRGAADRKTRDLYEAGHRPLWHPHELAP